jgi:hypothetical protein
MKINFKKISAIGASVLLTGMTMGVAAAASYPTPFVVGGNANAAVVYGALGALDVTPAYQLNVNLGEYVDAADTGSSTSADADDSYLFEKTSTKLHLGDHFVNISSSLDEDELPMLLADGKYVDDDNDEIDYTQKITMGSLGQLMMFDDDDYAADSPTIGFRIPSSQHVLTYQIDFSDTLLVTDMSTTELPLMGKSFYVLSNTSTTLTLLDSAASAIAAGDESITLDVDGTTYTVSASIFDTANSKVKLSINGETTNLLGNTETQKLTDGAYVGIKEVVVQNFAGGVNQVEFSIGKGKMKITDGGSEIQINDNSVAGLTGDFNLTANVLSRISLTWAADDDSFIAEDTTLTMPGFETIKLSYEGLSYPAEEVIAVKQGGTTYVTLDNFPLKDGEADIDFMYGNSTHFTGVGKDATHKLLTDDNNDGNITFNDNEVDEYFIASWTDTNDAESYLLKFSGFEDDGTNNITDLSIYKNGIWSVKKENAKATDTVQIGSVDITIGAVNKLGSTKNVEVWNSSANTATSITSFNTLYSAEGLTVYLPWVNTTALNYTNDTFSTAVEVCDWAQVTAADQIGELGYAGVVAYNNTATAVAADSNTVVTCTPEGTTFALKMVEEDKSSNKYAGDYFNVTLGWDSSTTPEAEVSDIVSEEVTFAEIGDTDVWRSFMYSALATEFLWNKPTSGQKSLLLTYHGSEVEASAWITSPDAVFTTTGGTTGSLGDVVMKDTDLAAGETRNLIIVGGSCVNTAAASVLGVSAGTCGDEWTSATGVGSGQFVIESFGTSSVTSGIALLVAGYEVADTTNAVTYLKTQVVDTAAGMKYIGTNSQTAELIVE